MHEIKTDGTEFAKENHKKLKEMMNNACKTALEEFKKVKQKI